MEIQRIGSFNAQDNKINRDGGIREDGESNALRFAHMVMMNNFSYLGTQELTIHYMTEIRRYLEDYQFYGSHRYGNGVLTKIPWNETNSIVTNQNVISSHTFGLPKARTYSEMKMLLQGHIMPRRIATQVIAEQESYGKICVINTHLDYETPSLQKRQLEAIKKLVLKNKENYPVVLTGDFNMQLTDRRFKDFVCMMKENGIERVSIDKATHQNENGKEEVLDHIFVSKDFAVVNAGVIVQDTYRETSDHYPIFADIKRR